MNLLNQIRRRQPAWLLLGLWIWTIPLPIRSQSLPTGGEVVGGQAGISQSGSEMLIQQSSQQAIIQWQDFSIGAGNTVQFVQPDATSQALNRVIGENLSQIYGTLRANGQVFLINPNGIVIGASGLIDTAGFVASTLSISNTDFLNNHQRYLATPVDGGIVNHGTIKTGLGGVTILSRSIENNGTIETKGDVRLAAGKEIYLVPEGGAPVVVTEAEWSKIQNNGTIKGGNIYAAAIKGLPTSRVDASNWREKWRVVNHGEIIAAKDFKARGGLVENTGQIKAGERADLRGVVTLHTGALEAREVRLGGDWHGVGEEHSQLTVVSGTVYSADSVIWSEERTIFTGAITSPIEGGRAEISSRDLLQYAGTVILPGGSLLLDPTNVTISSSPDDFISADYVWNVGNLTTTLNSNTSVTIVANNTISLVGGTNLTFSAGNLTLNAGQNIILDGDVTITAPTSALTLISGNVTINGLIVSNGSLSVNASGNVTQTQGMNVAQLNLLGAGNFQMSNTANQIGTLTATLTGSGLVNLVQAANTSLTVGTSNFGSGNVNLSADDFNLAGNVSGTGNLTLAATTNNRNMVIGGNTVGSLSLDTTEVNNITNGFASLTIGRSNSTGSLEVRDTAWQDPVTFRTTGNVVLNGNVTGTGNAQFTFNAAVLLAAASSVTAINQPISFLSTINGAQDLTLNAGSGAVNLNGAVGNSTALTNLNITATGGALTQATAWRVGNLTASVGSNALTLGNAGNNFTGSVNLTNSGNNAVTLVTSGNLTLGTITLGNGAASFTSGSGNIGQTSALSLAGNSTFTASAGNITLTNVANDFSGTISLISSGNTTVTDANNITLGASTISVGNLQVTASNGSITQTAATTVNGASSFSATNGNIVLTQTNNFIGNVSLAVTGSNNISVTDTNALILGTVTLPSGNLNVISNGALSQSTALTIAGASSFNAGAGTITLNNPANNFTGSVSLANTGANAVTLLNNTSLTLGTSNIGTGLTTITSANGNLTQSGALTINGTANFTASNGTMTLGNTTNNFAGTTNLTSAGNITIADSGALILGTVSITAGNLNVTTAGNLTQSTALAVNGNSSFSVGTGGLDLTNAANNFTGSVAITSTGNNTIALVNNADLVLGTSSIANSSLTLTSTGNITQTGALTQTLGAGNVSLTSTTGSILMENTSNDFRGNVSASVTGGNTLSLTDANSMTLDTITLGTGTLVLRSISAGLINQNQAITASQLLLLGSGTIQLVNTSNSFGTVAGNITGSGSIALRDDLGGSIIVGNVTHNNVTTSGLTLGTGVVSLVSVNITVNSSISTGGAGNITLRANDLALNANVSGSQQLTIITAATNSTIGLGTGASGTMQLDNTELARLTNGFAAINIGSNTTGTIDLRSSNWTDPLILTSNQNITLNGNISGTGDAGFTFNNPVVLTGTSNVTSANQSITFSSTINGNQNLNLSAANGTVTLGGVVGGLSTLDSLTASSNGNLLLNSNVTTFNNIGLTSTAGNISGTGRLTTFFGNLNLQAATGVADPTANLQVDAATLTANTSSGNVAITNYATNTTVNGLSTVGGPIYYLQVGNGNLVLAGNVTSGDAGTVGGSITIQSLGTLTLNAGREVSSIGNGSASTGTATIDGSTINGTVSAATGTSISLNGAGADLKINSNIGAANATYSAERDIIISANVTSVSGITFTADSNQDGFGGVWIQFNGLIDSGGDVVITGSDVFATLGGTADSVTVDSTAAGGTRINAAGNISISSSNHTNTPTAAQVVLSGNISAGGAINIDAKNNITLGNVNTTVSLGSNGTVSFAKDVTMIGASSVRGSSVTFANTVGGYQNLTLNVTGSGGTLSQNNTWSLNDLTVNAGNNAVSLTNAANDFTGNVRFNVTGSNQVSVRDANSIQFGATTIGTGLFTVQADLAITQSAAIVTGGNSNFTSANNRIDLTNAGNDFGGSIHASVTGTNYIALSDVNALQLGTIALGNGTLTVTANGTISQLSALTVLGDSTFNAGAGAINLTNAANNFTGNVNLANTGNNNVAITDSNAIQFGNVTVGNGTLTVTTSGAITQIGNITQQAGAGTTTFNSGGNAITLTTTSNDFTGNVSLTSTSGGVSLTDANNLTLGNVSSGTGALTITASDLNLTGTLTGSGNLILQPISNATTIGLGTGATGAFNLTSAELANITDGFASITIGAAGSTGAVDLRDSTWNDPVTFRSTGALSLNGNITTPSNVSFSFTGPVLLTGDSSVVTNNTIAFNSTINGNQALTVNAGTSTATFAGAIGNTTALASLNITATGGALTQAAAWQATNLTVDVGNNTITLNNGGNRFTGLVNLTNSGNNGMTLTTTGNLTLGTISHASGTASFTGGNISQTSALNLSVNTNFIANAGSIDLSNSANDFTGNVRLTSTGNATVVDANNLDLGLSNVTGNLIATASNGNLTQSAALTVNGTSSFSATNGTITLTQANDFNGAVSLTGNNTSSFSLTDSNAIILGTVTLPSGNLSVTSNGALSQTSALIIAGTSSFNAGNGTIALGLANNFTGAVSLNNSGNNAVTLNTSGNLLLSTSNVGTGLTTITSTGGSIAQSGALTINGNSVFTTTNNTITLLNPANNFVGSLSLTTGGGDAAVRDTNALQLGSISLGTGNLSVTSNGALSQTAALTLAGTSNFSAGNGTIALTLANNFTGAVSLNNSGNNAVSLNNSGNLQLGASAIGNGTLTVSTTGNITQLGSTSLTQSASAGATTFTTTGGSIALTQSNNDFTGSVSLNATGNATLADANALSLGLSNVTGNLQITTTNGTISQIAALTVGGLSNFTAGGTGSINLSNASNSFGGVVQLTSGGSISIADSTDLDLGLLTTGTGANLTVSTNGNLTQSAALVSSGTATFTTTNSGTSQGLITLNNANNTLTGNVSLNTVGNNAVTLVNNTSLTLGLSTLGNGTLSITANNGGIAQSAALTANGTSSFTANGGDLFLTSANNFVGNVNLSVNGTNNISITDTNDLALNTLSTVNGTLTLSVGGNLTQAQALTVTALNLAGTGNYQLTNTTNAIGTLTAALTGSGLVNLVQAANTSLTVGTSTFGSGNINLSADNFTLTGNLSGTGNLVLQPVTANSTIGLGNSAVGTFNLDTTEVSRLSNGFASIIIGASNSTGTIDLRNTSWNDPVTFRTTGNISLQGNVAGTDNATLLFTAPVIVAGTSNVSTANQNITFNSTINGAQSLTINAGTANATFNGNIGNTAALSNLAVTAGGNLTFTGDTNVTTNLNVTTTGGQISSGGTLRASSLNLTAANGIYNGVSNYVQTAASNITASAGSGALRLNNTLATNVSIMGLSTVGQVIDYYQLGGGNLTIAGNITTGNATTMGGNITIFNNATVGGELTVNTVLVSTAGNSGSGGTITVVGTILNTNPIAGTGNILLRGSGPDTYINSNVTSAGNISYSSSRDIIIDAKLDAGTFIDLTADDDGVGGGGVQITVNGSLVAVGNITINGSDLYTNGLGDLNGIVVNDNGSITNKINAGGNIVFSSNSNNTNSIITLSGNITSSGGTATFDRAVSLTGTSLVNADNIVFNSTISGTQDLTLTADASANGTISLGGNVNIRGLSLTSTAGNFTLAHNISTTGTGNALFLNVKEFDANVNTSLNASGGGRYVLYSQNRTNDTVTPLAGTYTSRYGESYSVAQLAALGGGNRIVWQNTPTANVTVSNSTAVYGDTPVYTVNVTGAFDTQDRDQMITEGLTMALGTAQPSVSNYTISNTATTNITNSLNYTLSYTQNATLSITPRPITVNVSAGLNKDIGASDPAFTYALTGTLGYTDLISGALSRAAGEAAGLYAYNIGSLSLASNPNYNVTFSTTDQFTINNSTPLPPPYIPPVETPTGPPIFVPPIPPAPPIGNPTGTNNNGIALVESERLLPTKRLPELEKLVPPPETGEALGTIADAQKETYAGEGEFMPSENIDLNAEGGESDNVPTQFVMIGFDNEIEVRNGPLLIREFVMLDQTPPPTELQPWVGAELTNESVREMILILEPRGYGFPNQLSRAGLVRIAPLSLVNSLRVNTQVLQ